MDVHEENTMFSKNPGIANYSIMRDTSYSSGSYLKLKTDCDVMLSWNGKSVVQVVIPQKYGDAVTGICGNCNGRQDDYRTRKGLDVSNKRNKYSLVGNSYEVTGDKDGIDR
jgi:hypothetical protein